MESATVILVIVAIVVLAAVLAQFDNRRLQAMLDAGDIPGLVRRGWRVESETGDYVVVVKNHRVNHLLHFLVTVFTVGLWLIPWILISITGGERRKTAVRPPPSRE